MTRIDLDGLPIDAKAVIETDWGWRVGTALGVRLGVSDGDSVTLTLPGAEPVRCVVSAVWEMRGEQTIHLRRLPPGGWRDRRQLKPGLRRPGEVECI